MNLVYKILEELAKPALRYKGMRVNLLGLPSLEQSPRASLKTTLWRLKKRQLIERDLKGWCLTPAGKKYMEKKSNSLIDFDFTFPKNSEKNLLVMYDIPEHQKAEREWFRWHLKKFGYEMIQRSVWVGPSPLPKQFLKYLEKIKLRRIVKTFKLAKPYSYYKNRQV